MSLRDARRALGAALTITLLTLLLLPRAASAVEVGTVPDITWGTSRATIDKTVDMLKQSGVSWIRASVPWNAIEPDRPGVYNQSYLSDIDYAIAKARAAGLQVIMPVQDGVPYWASADPNKYLDSAGAKHYRQTYHPANYGDFASFFSFVVNRYKAQGVHAYEVWNEPNLARFWPSGPDAGEYTEMLKAAYPAIKAADPNSTVILGGLSGNDRTYLASVYAHGGGRYFDALGLHPYAWGDPANCWKDATGHNASDAFCGIEEIRKVMTDNGDASKPIWITEMGWSTCRNAATACLQSGVTEAQQADYTVRAFNLIDARYPYVKVAVVYNFRNDSWLHDDPNDWEAQMGLMTTGFVPKPAFSAIAAYAKTHGGPSSPPPLPSPTPSPTPSPSPTPTPTPTPTHKPKPKPRASKTRIALRTSGSALAHSARRGARRPAVHPKRARLVGYVSHAGSGRVRVGFQRWNGRRGHWSRRVVRVERVRAGGTFRIGAHVAAHPGLWRVRAHFLGTRGVRRSASSFRHFRVT